MRVRSPLLVLALVASGCMNLGGAPTPAASATPAAKTAGKPAATPTPATGCAGDFKAADADGNGGVSFDEYAAFRTKDSDPGSTGMPAVKVSLQADFDRLDAAKDGRLTQAEFCAMPSVPRDAE